MTFVILFLLQLWFSPTDFITHVRKGIQVRLCSSISSSYQWLAGMRDVIRSLLPYILLINNYHVYDCGRARIFYLLHDALNRHLGKETSSVHDCPKLFRQKSYQLIENNLHDRPGLINFTVSAICVQRFNEIISSTVFTKSFVLCSVFADELRVIKWSLMYHLRRFMVSISDVIT